MFRGFKFVAIALCGLFGLTQGVECLLYFLVLLFVCCSPNRYRPVFLSLIIIVLDWVSLVDVYHSQNGIIQAVYWVRIVFIVYQTTRVLPMVSPTLSCLYTLFEIKLTPSGHTNFNLVGRSNIRWDVWFGCVLHLIPCSAYDPIGVLCAVGLVWTCRKQSLDHELVTREAKLDKSLRAKLPQPLLQEIESRMGN
jgi:hypothetical protein